MLFVEILIESISMYQVVLCTKKCGAERKVKMRPRIAPHIQEVWGKKDPGIHSSLVSLSHSTSIDRLCLFIVFDNRIYL